MIGFTIAARASVTTHDTKADPGAFADIERALGTNEYPRLRIGIDPAPAPMRGKDYVLGRFTTEQRKLLEPAIDRATGAILTWIDKGIETAMSLFNAGEKE